MSSSEVNAPKVEDGHQYPVIGEFNHLEASIGQRGMGKSTHQAYRAWQLREDSGGAFIVGHSLGSRLPERLPLELGGHVLPIVYYQTIEKLDKGLRRHPEKWHILAPPKESIDGVEPESADDLLRYVDRLSTALRRKAWEKQNHNPFVRWNDQRKTLGLRSPPVICLVDEGIAVESASTGNRSRGKDKWFLQFIYSLRHDNVALLYSIQEPSSRSWRVLEAATSIYVFRVGHKWALLAIEAAGATREQAIAISQLPPHEYVVLHSSDIDASAGERAAEEEKAKGEAAMTKES